MKKLILLTALLTVASCGNDERHDDAARSVGNYLVESSLSGALFSGGNNSHPNIVRVGDSLKSKFKELTPTLSNDCTSELVKNHDKEASHVLMLICGARPVIGLRLKFDDGYNAFHIIGYWSSGLGGCAPDSAQMNELEVREFLRRQYGEDVETMSIKYDSITDRWHFKYDGPDDCIDCDYSGAVEDSKYPKIIDLIMDG